MKKVVIYIVVLAFCLTTCLVGINLNRQIIQPNIDNEQEFKTNFTEHILLAKDSNNIEVVYSELSTAISYFEHSESIYATTFAKSENLDVKVWWNNLLVVKEDLKKKIDENVMSPFEQLSYLNEVDVLITNGRDLNGMNQTLLIPVALVNEVPVIPSSLLYELCTVFGGLFTAILVLAGLFIIFAL